MRDIVTFPGYGVNAQPITIICSRITHWRQVDYNGIYGTEIFLDTGKSVLVEMFPDDVEKLVFSDE